MKAKSIGILGNLRGVSVFLQFWVRTVPAVQGGCFRLFLCNWVARMLVQRRVMSWRRVATSLQAPAAHGLLLTFTLLLVLKLDHAVSYSWWIIFAPLWLFHAVVARGRFSLPAPSMPHDRHKTTHFSFMDSGHHFMPSQRRRCLLLLNYSFVYISSTVML